MNKYQIYILKKYVEYRKKKLLILKKPDEKIKQGRISDILSHFSDNFFKTFNLQKYTTTSQPCIFFGCYNEQDLYTILKHKSIKIILWAGSDSYYKKRPFAIKALSILKQIKNTFHI